jgi:uncharacterized protein YchJ
MRFTDKTLGQQTFDTTTSDADIYESVAKPLMRLAKKEGAQILTTTQVGRLERIAYLHIPGVVQAPVYNLAVYPEAGSSPEYKRRVRVYKQQRHLLVPVYRRLTVHYTLHGKPEVVFTSEDSDDWQDHNLVYMAAQLLLDGNMVWVDPDVDTFQRKRKKVGANAPCPCGSGKKFKKCCRR